MGGENEESGGRKRKRKVERIEGATTPREISVFFASSRSSMLAYGDGSNRYSMNSKNLLLAEGTPTPVPPSLPSPLCLGFVRRDEKAHPIPDAADARSQKGTDNKCLQHASLNFPRN